MEYYQGQTPCHFIEYLVMDILEIRQLNEGLSLPKGYFRVANWNEKNLLIDWHIKLTKDALHEEISYEDFKNKLTSRIENKKIYLFENEKHELMAIVASTKQLINGVSISLVYSSQEARGQGYELRLYII